MTDLLQFIWEHGYTREEATPEAEQEWGDTVKELYGMMLMRKAQGWFTGYNSNVDGHEAGDDALPRLQRRHAEVPPDDRRVADDGYAGIELR